MARSDKEAGEVFGTYRARINIPELCAQQGSSIHVDLISRQVSVVHDTAVGLAGFLTHRHSLQWVYGKVRGGDADGDTIEAMAREALAREYAGWLPSGQPSGRETEVTRAARPRALRGSAVQAVRLHIVR